VAPCVVHTLDTYFNALVLMELSGEFGVRNVVAIHDSWFVPGVHNHYDMPGSMSPGGRFSSAASGGPDATFWRGSGPCPASGACTGGSWMRHSARRTGALPARSAVRCAGASPTSVGRPFTAT